jgi:hypothetical protein
MFMIDAASVPKTLDATTFVDGNEPAVQQISLTPGVHSSWEINHAPGTYVVLVFATWDEGDISYGFKINIQP